MQNATIVRAVRLELLTRLAETEIPDKERCAMTPTRVRNPLASVLRRVDPDRRLRAYKVWTFWDDEVGEAIAARAQPVALRAGVLTVAVSSHTWMQELQFLRDDIIRRLNTRLGETLITDLFLVSATVEERKARGPRPRGEEESPPRAPVAIPPLHDPRLAAVFERLAQAQARHRRA
jgi:predicted nucleic acid-binding Zn ribbon protein